MNVVDQSKPSVTLCILCFNQQRYIRDAMEAAMRQAGDPIEIIVSDDGSSDRTLDVARDVAAAYPGPHRIIVRQTPRNLGTLHHVFDVAEMATGDLVIVGAGDDVSLPDRVERLVNVWQREESGALFSAYRIIDDAGTVLEDHHRFDDSWLPVYDYLPGRKLVSIHGASSAYDRVALLALPRPAGRILFEDVWLTLMLSLAGRRISFVDQPLVAYRQHAASITNFVREHSTRATILESDRQAFRSAGAYRDAVRSFRDQAAASDRQGRIAFDVVDRDLAFFTAQAAWPDLSWPARVAATARARQPWMRRWGLLRLLAPGLRLLVERARIRQRAKP